MGQMASFCTLGFYVLIFTTKLMHNLQNNLYGAVYSEVIVDLKLTVVTAHLKCFGK